MWESKPLFSDEDTNVELRDSSVDLSINEKDEESLVRTPEDSWLQIQNSTLAKVILICAAAVARFIPAFFRYLVPSFLRRNTHDASTSSQPKRSSAQSALDGLRGLACLIVAFYHFFGYSFEVNYGYIWNDEEPNGGNLATIWNYPFVKLPMSGPNMVAIFFIISGYVLTHRFLSLVHQGKVDNALSAMSSATFRRFFRLYAPVFVVTFILQILLQLGLFDSGRKHFDGRPYPPKGESGILEQAALFWQWCRGAINVFSWERNYPDQFDGNIWTIPVEFRCSMVLFLVSIGLARVKTHLRIAGVIICMAWGLNAVLWEIVLFLMGMLLAQFDVLYAARKKAEEENLEKPEPATKSSKIWFWIPYMYITLYLCSVPWHHEGAWGWETLSALDPFPGGFVFSTWQFVGATMMVVSALHCETVQGFLNWAPIQYLGHSSYALYLVHGSIVKLCTYSLKWELYDAYQHQFEGKQEHDRWHMQCVWISFAVFIPSLIIVSDVFMRAVDQPCVTWGRKIWEHSIAQ